MRGYFLDDERNPSDVTWMAYPDGIEWTVCRTIQDLIMSLASSGGFPGAYISLDHDLGAPETGMDAVKAIVGIALEAADMKASDLPTIVVHSKNPIGAENIESYWVNYVKFMKEWQ